MIASEKITKARTQLIIEEPFYGLLALRLKVEERPDIPTAAVDGVHLFYNPLFIDSLQPQQIVGLIAHEVMHIALMHHARRNNRNPEKWNKANDYAINPQVLNAGFVLPPNGLIDPQYNNMSSEHIYNMLPNDPSNQSSNSPASPPWNFGDVMDLPEDVSPDFHEQEIKIAVAQAAQAAKMAGKLSNDIEKLVATIVDSKVDWRDVLRNFIKETAKNDYSWRRANRRFISRGFYFPGLHSETIGEVVVAIDTSGSISSAEMSQFAAELKSIIEDVHPKKAHVIYCDAHVKHTQTFEPDDFEISIEPKGGGGTRFEPVFDHVNNNNIQPVCLVYLTDMYGTFPSDIPYYPVLWISTTNKDEAPFGEVIKL